MQLAECCGVVHSASEMSSGPRPAVSYALLASRSVIGTRGTASTGTQKRRFHLHSLSGEPRFFHSFFTMSTAAAAPSPTGAHIDRVIGQLTIRSVTPSSLMRLVYCAMSFSEAW